MKNTYTVAEVERENIMKMLARYQKKGAAYGQELKIEAGDPYAKKIAVYDQIVDHHGILVQTKIGDQMVEVFDLTIDSDIIKKDGYSVIAKIEHLDGGNVVYNMTEENHPEWSSITPRCQHCGCDHGQKVTFIVRNESGEEMQVGRTCLKDYCGIDPQRIGMLKQVTDIFLDMDVDHYDFTEHPMAHAYDTLEVLALAIRAMKQQGYRSSKDGNGSNKEVMLRMMGDGERISDDEYTVAKELAKKIMQVELNMANKYLLDNVQMLIRNQYCKENHFGYIAYAPLAYERCEEAMERNRKYEQEKAQEQKKSGHIGSIGQRLNIDVSDMKLLTSWESEFGYTYLYKITDTSGNVLVWYASKTMKNASRIRATVKAHTDYNGVKQTIVTRCVVVEK